MSPRLRAYLSLEREMLELEAIDDDAADLLRDAMDPMWYSLTDEDHAWLDARPIGPLPSDPWTELAAGIELLEWPTPFERVEGLAA